MHIRRLLVVGVPLLLAWPAAGQGLTDGEIQALTASVEALRPVAKHPLLPRYLAQVKLELGAGRGLPPGAVARQAEAARKTVANVLQLADDAAGLPADSPWLTAPYLGYAVPAVSPIRRTPDSLPPDGRLDARFRIVAAQGEFEPVSFVLAPLADVARLEVKATALSGADGTIPADRVDIKLVKCWWQPATAWNSYFNDPSGRELVPDLLLKDDALIRVDLAKQEHYLRVDYPGGAEYVWVSYPYPATSRIAGEHRFDYHREPVADSPVLLPLKLTAGRAQQFWVTVHVPETTAAGSYAGRIELVADGAPAGHFALQLQVLPFALPDPRTYYDLEKPFITTMDGLGTLKSEKESFGGDSARAEQRLRALYKNQRDHNIFNFSGLHILSYNSHFRDIILARVMESDTMRGELVRQLELIREAGFRPPLIAAAQADISARVKLDDEEGARHFKENIAASAQFLDAVEKVLGHREVYFWGRGEPSRGGLIEQFTGFDALHGVGVKIGQEAKAWHLDVAGHLEDLVNLGGNYYDRQYTAPWHAMGQRVLSYASPHPGAENPDLSRRCHGMMLYKAWFDGTKNNTWVSHRQNWLDFWNPYGYRICMIYPTRDGVIGTMAWEGFREGIDDVRYATKLKQVAASAIAGGKAPAVTAAKRALLWLERHDEKGGDLDAMRLEMIDHILALQALL